MSDPLRIGISSCLLGNRVRYDGNHTHDVFLTQVLGHFVEYVAVCPEVECGMTIPREPIWLMGNSEHPRLVTRETGIERTPQMTAWAEERLNLLEHDNLCGFIFKNKSPSCGRFQVKVHDQAGRIAGRGTGIFARAFTRRFPAIPVEESQRLQDPGLRKHFIERLVVSQSQGQALYRAVEERASQGGM